MEVLLDDIITWYIFFYSLTWKLWNKFATNIFNVLEINFINFIRRPLKDNLTWHGHFNLILKTILEGHLNIVDPIIITFYTLMTKTMTSPTGGWTSITSQLSSLLYHWFSLMMMMLLFCLRIFTMGYYSWRTLSLLSKRIWCIKLL